MGVGAVGPDDEYTVNAGAVSGRRATGRGASCGGGAAGVDTSVSSSTEWEDGSRSPLMLFPREFSTKVTASRTPLSAIMASSLSSPGKTSSAFRRAEEVWEKSPGRALTTICSTCSGVGVR